MPERLGRVLYGSNNIFCVHVEQARLECRIKGKVLRGAEGDYNPLSPGDWVVVEDLDGVSGAILERRPRANALRRLNKKTRSAQTLAANVDLVACVTSPANPPFRPRFIDRVALAADDAGVEVLVILNKSDLAGADWIEERLAAYQRIGYRTLRVCALSGGGFDELRRVLERRLTVFVGQSGVGKSSLLNRLLPGAALRTAGVSTKYDRGRHTTVCGRLEPWNSEAGLIDTPGIREFEPYGLDQQRLPFLFRDFAPFMQDCGLSGCTHEHEPACAVKAAVDAGLILADRYESYLRILADLRALRRTSYE